MDVQARINEVNQAMIRGGLQFGATAEKPQDITMYPFRKEKADYSVYWDVRKGLIPIVGGARESGMVQMLFPAVLCPCTFGICGCHCIVAVLFACLIFSFFGAEGLMNAHCQRFSYALLPVDSQAVSSKKDS